ncbi:MAG TPA: hypothetical protein VI958_08850, partial [Acidobacteriota bacterium]
LKPFLVHLAESISYNAHALDDEMPFFLFAHITNILEHRGSHTFTESQRRAISSLVKESLNLLASLPEGIWIEDVSKQAQDLARVLREA